MSLTSEKSCKLVHMQCVHKQKFKKKKNDRNIRKYVEQHSVQSEKLIYATKDSKQTINIRHLNHLDLN